MSGSGGIATCQYAAPDWTGKAGGPNDDLACLIIDLNGSFTCLGIIHRPVDERDNGPYPAGTPKPRPPASFSVRSGCDSNTKRPINGSRHVILTSACTKRKKTKRVFSLSAIKVKIARHYPSFLGARGWQTSNRLSFPAITLSWRPHLSTLSRRTPISWRLLCLLQVKTDKSRRLLPVSG